MIPCTIWANFGFKAVDNRKNNKPVDFKLATLDYDPGWKVGDQFIIVNTSNSVHDYLPVKEMEVIIKQRYHILKLDKEQDILEIRIFVEIADKEDFQQIRETLQRFNPGKFENIE